MTAAAWAVTWRRKPIAVPFLIDFDNESLAIRASVALNEIGRYDVAVTVTEYDDDPEMKARIWARVAARMREMPPAVFA